MSEDQRHVRLAVFVRRILNAEAMRKAVAGPGDGFTARDWVVVFQRVRKDAKEDNVGLIAAGVAFYAILSIIPLLIGVMAVAALVAGPARVREQLGPLADILPRPVARSLTSQLSDAVAAMSGQGRTLGLVIGLLGVLWTCSRGFGALINGLHVMIDETDTRGVIRQRATALALAAGALVTALGALWLVAAVPRIGLRDADVAVGFAIRCALLAVVVLVGLILLYRYGTDRPQADWHAVRWGAGIAMTAWLLMSTVLAVYVASTGGRSSTYGTLAGAAAIATWLYMSCYIILLGAEINAEIERLLGRRSAFRDDPKPGEQPQDQAESKNEGRAEAQDKGRAEAQSKSQIVSQKASRNGDQRADRGEEQKVEEQSAEPHPGNVVPPAPQRPVPSSAEQSAPTPPAAGQSEPATTPPANPHPDPQGEPAVPA